MEPSPASRRPGPPPPPPTTGSLLNGRYKLTGFIGRSAFGEMLRAEDVDDHSQVAVIRVRSELVATQGAVERLAAEVARACTLEHPNIIKPLNFLTDAEHVYVVSQLPEGQTLRSIITARKGRFTLRDANGIISQLSNALTYAAGITHHGAITPSSIFVESSGLVRLAEMGLARALPASAADVDPADRSALAPELPASSGRSDIYALGAILFELTTGRSYVAGILPRNVKPDLPPDIDALVSCLVEPSPDDRFADVDTLRTTLANIVAAVEADHLSRRQEQTRRASTSSKTVADKQKRKRIKVDHHEHRWLVHRGKADYGPYTLTELKQQIEKDEVVPGDLIIDMELGTRAEAEAHPLIHDLVLAAAQRRDDARRHHVETTHVASEKRRGFALYGTIGLGAAVLVTGAILTVNYVRAGAAAGPRKEAAQLAMFDVGGLKVGTARRDDDRDLQRRSRGPRAPRPTTTTTTTTAGTAGGKDGFDEALSFDMVGEEVGDERLSDEQINGVLMKNVSSLGRCLQAEAGRGGPRQADIDFIVLGGGKVSQVRVNGETGSPLASCIRSAMLSMSFPPFNGPRTKASFPMSL